MSTRTQALAAALTARGYVAAGAFDAVTIVGPEHTTTTIRLGDDVDGYLCVFSAEPASNPRAWAAWTAEIRAAAAAAWPTVERFPIPDPPPPAIPAPRAPALAYDRPLWVAPDPGLHHGLDETQRGYLTPVRSWQLDCGMSGPAVHWHAWGAPTAAQCGAAQGWATLAGERVTDAHAHESKVHAILAKAAETTEHPGGVVALDIRGLSTRAVKAVARGLHTRACAGVLLCDDMMVRYLVREVLNK